MNLSRHDNFRSICQVLSADVLPGLCRAEKLSLRVSCLGTVNHDGGDDADGIDRTVPLGQCPSPEEAMDLAALRVSRGDIHVDPGDTLRFHSLTPEEASALDRAIESTIARRASEPSPIAALVARAPRAPRPTIVHARGASDDRPSVTYRASGDRHLLVD